MPDSGFQGRTTSSVTPATVRDTPGGTSADLTVCGPRRDKHVERSHRVFLGTSVAFDADGPRAVQLEIAVGDIGALYQPQLPIPPACAGAAAADREPLNDMRHVADPLSHVPGN